MNEILLDDLNKQIQIYTIRINGLKIEKRKVCAQTFGGPSGYIANSGIEPTGVRGSSVHMPIDKGIERIEEIENLISQFESTRQMLQEQVNDINKLLYSLEGRQYKIFRLRKCENKSFQEIATEIGMSLSQVKRIYKEVVGSE